MSWKAVEMQIALPRTHDAGKLQDQMQQRGQQAQYSLAQSQLETDKLKRKQVTKEEQKDKVDIKDERENSNYTSSEKEKKKDSPGDTSAINVNHPYLGKQVDFSG